MGIEVACPGCEGRLLVAAPGVVVACPHCGTHLSLPEEPFAKAVPAFPGGSPGDGPTSFPDLLAAAATASPALPAEEDVKGAAPAPSDEKTLTGADRDAADRTAETVEGPDFTKWSAGPARPDFSGWSAAPRLEPDRTAVGVSEGGVASDNGAAARVTDAVATLAAVIPSPDDEPPSTGAPVATVAAPAAEAPAPPASRLAFLLLLSYASAVTIALVGLWFRLNTASPHQLESLPDVVPEVDRRSGNIVPKLVSENAPMPRGHTLRLGESQRYGSVVVTPLRVTRGPLEFQHFSNPGEEAKAPTGDVLKLWLRFRNVSADQSFPPLGKPLVYLRGRSDRDRSRIQANQFVSRDEDKRPNGHVVLLYDLVVTDVWDLKGQNIDHVLEPDEELETYLPTSEEGIDRLRGELVWRVHFRKGYHPESLRGVTTLIEVEFHSDEIQAGA